jgi:hypothetical protein
MIVEAPVRITVAVLRLEDARRNDDRFRREYCSPISTHLLSSFACSSGVRDSRK